MFSYGFQPWAALTGQQILEAIDEPNFQVITFLVFIFFFVTVINIYVYIFLEIRTA